MDLSWNLTFPFLAFSALTVGTTFNDRLRPKIFERNSTLWLVDILSLVSQGIAVPIVQSALGFWIFPLFFPLAQGSVSISAPAAFLLGFIGVDYVYYWNHRLLHSKPFWRWHRLHHSVKNMDFLVTSRNSILTPLFIVYLWINSIFLFILENPRFYFLAISMGASLDLWRHSGLRLNESTRIFRVLSKFLILPQDHSRHHLDSQQGFNFGANLNWWDRLHGTWNQSAPSNAEVDQMSRSNVCIWRDWLWPKKV